MKDCTTCQNCDFESMDGHTHCKELNDWVWRTDRTCPWYKVDSDKKN